MFLGDNLENCVGLFEGFMKQIYSHKIMGKCSEDEAEPKLKSIGNKFQNLNRSRKIFDDEFEIELFENISEEDYEFLQIQFAKRHVLTHNLGLVDKKYLSQVESWQKPGQEVPLCLDEISQTLDLIREVITNLL